LVSTLACRSRPLCDIVMLIHASWLGFFLSADVVVLSFLPTASSHEQAPRLIANQKRRYASIFTHTTQRPCQRTLHHPNHFLHPTWFLRFFFSPLAPCLRSPNPAMKAGAGLGCFRDSPGRACLSLNVFTNRHPGPLSSQPIRARQLAQQTNQLLLALVSLVHFLAPPHTAVPPPSPTLERVVLLVK
jgi:hypothetical protein